MTMLHMSLTLYFFPLTQLLTMIRAVGLTRKTALGWISPMWVALIDEYFYTFLSRDIKRSYFLHSCPIWKMEPGRSHKATLLWDTLPVNTSCVSFLLLIHCLCKYILQKSWVDRLPSMFFIHIALSECLVFILKLNQVARPRTRRSELTCLRTRPWISETALWWCATLILYVFL